MSRRYSALKLLQDYFIARINRCSVACIMALTPQSSGNHEIGRLDRETPRVGPIAAGEDNDLLRKLLAEVTAIRKENLELKSEVENLKSGAKRKLFPKPKESDPECSVSIFDPNFRYSKLLLKINQSIDIHAHSA